MDRIDMPPSPPDAAAAGEAAFLRLRPRLFGIAYRMLGVRADAEDVLQDVWLRWHGAERAEITNSEAWLVAVTTRIAIDRLRAAKAAREHYPGQWLPEPLVELDEDSPERLLERAGDLSLAFLWVLERLKPEERAAFLLRQVFDCDYADIAAWLGKTEAACRQLVHRAAERVREARPRHEVSRERHRALLERFAAAARDGRREDLMALMADDAESVGDGGGKATAVASVLRGAERIANLFWAVALRLTRAQARVELHVVDLNGEPGLLRLVDGQVESVQSITTDGERILGIYTVRNPDKLAGIRWPLRR